MIDRPDRSRYRMPIRERFKRLNLWNKISVVGAFASIFGILLTLLLTGVPLVSRLLGTSPSESAIGSAEQPVAAPVETSIQMELPKFPQHDDSIEYKVPEGGTPLPDSRIKPEVDSAESRHLARVDSATNERPDDLQTLPERSWDDPIDLSTGPELAFWMDEAALPDYVHLPESEQAKHERFSHYAVEMMRCATAFDHIARMRRAGWNVPIILELASCSLLNQSSENPVTERDVLQVKVESYAWVAERHRQLDSLFYHYVGECMGWLRRAEQLFEEAGFSGPQAVREIEGSLDYVFRNFVAPSDSAAEVFSPEQSFYLQQVFRGISMSSSMWGTGNVHTWCKFEDQNSASHE